MKHELKLCVQHLGDFCADLDMSALGWELDDSAEIGITVPEECEMCRLATEELICIECGNDLASEGQLRCTECLEKL